MPGKDFEREPLIVVVCSYYEGALAELHAGQAMQRVLLTATTLGLSASFIAQPIEVPSCREELRRLLGAGITAQTILRIGHGSPIAPTPRRPVAELLIDAAPVLPGGTTGAALDLRRGDRLGCAVRVVHCQPRGARSERRNSVFDLVSLIAGRYPAMPVQLHTLGCAPAEALAWHSQFASMAVMGLGRIHRRVLREAACPVVIAGPDTILDVAHAASALDTARS